MSAVNSSRVTPKGESPGGAPEIDPALADLPPPPHHSNGSASASGPAANTSAITAASNIPRDSPYPLRVPGEPTSITESIATAPNPHTADFSPLPFTQDASIDVVSLDDAAGEEPGSPTARLLRAIAPPGAAQPNPTWARVSYDREVARPQANFGPVTATSCTLLTPSLHRTLVSICSSVCVASTSYVSS